MGAEESPGKLKGRGAKTRKTRVVKREAYSRRDFKGFPNGEEIYDTITRLIDEEKIEPNKREGIFCTVFKHLQANARKSINFPVHEMTPDLGGSESLGTKELLAVLLSISRREVDKLVEHSTKELKVDVFVELSEGTNTLIRFPIRYYTTSEDLIGYVLKDRGVADSPLDYQLAVVKSPFKGKNKIKSMMCAVGANLNSPVAHKQARTLYPHQYPLQELGEAPKVIYTNNDVLPRVVSAYFYVTPREAQPLTVYHRRKDGKVEEDVLYLRTSVNANEVIEQCIDNFDLENDPIAYKLVMKTFEFEEIKLTERDKPLTLKLLYSDDPDTPPEYPQFIIEGRTPTTDEADLCSSKSAASMCSSGAMFAYAGSNKTENDLTPTDNTESFNFLTLTDKMRMFEAHFDDKGRIFKSKESEGIIRENFKELLIAFENEKHSKDKLRMKRDKMKSQLRDVAKELATLREENSCLKKDLKEERAQKQLFQVENKSLKDEADYLKRKIDVLEDLRKEPKDEKVQSVHLGSVSMTSSSEGEYKALYESLLIKQKEVEDVMNGTMEKLKSELTSVKLEKMLLEAENSELTQKVNLLEPKHSERIKEIDNINEMIAALNKQVEEVTKNCRNKQCPSALELEKRINGKELSIVTLQNQLNKAKMKKRELGIKLASLESQVTEMESKTLDSDERYVALVKEAEQMRCKLTDKEEMCKGGSCPNAVRFKSQDNEAKITVRQNEDKINVLSAKVEKLKATKLELRKELAVHRMESANTDNILQEMTREKKKLEKEWCDMKEEVDTARLLCQEGKCSSRRGSEECSDLLDEFNVLRKKFTKLSVERDLLKTKTIDAEANFDKLQTQNKLICEENAALSEKIAELERQVEAQQPLQQDVLEKGDEENLHSSSTKSLLDNSYSGKPTAEQLHEAKIKIEKQKQKIQQLRIEYGKLKDVISETSSKVYTIMSDNSQCVKATCKEIKRQAERSALEAHELRLKQDKLQNINSSLDSRLATLNERMKKKREDYSSLQKLLRTTLDNCKDLELRIKEQARVIEIAELKGWVDPSPKTSTPNNGEHGADSAPGYKPADSNQRIYSRIRYGENANRQKR